jgi:hypothetical protein
VSGRYDCGLNKQLAVHDDVHSDQLRPDLGEDSDMCAPNHVRFDQLEIGNVGILSLEFTHVLNLSKLGLDEVVFQIVMSMNKSENLMAVLPSILLCEPAGRLWQNEEAEEEQNGGNHLKTPWQSESGVATNEGATARNIEHDENAPNCPLLCAHYKSSLTWSRKLRDVDRNLCRADTNGQAVDESSHDEHANIL